MFEGKLDGLDFFGRAIGEIGDSPVLDLAVFAPGSRVAIIFLRGIPMAVIPYRAGRRLSAANTKPIY